MGGELEEFADWATLTRKAGFPTWRGTGMEGVIFSMDNRRKRREP